MAPHTWLGISASEFVLFSGRKKATFLRAGGIHFQTGTEVIDSRGRSPVKPVPLALNSAVSQVLTIPVLASGPNATTTCPWLRGQPPSLPPSLSLSLPPSLPLLCLPSRRVHGPQDTGSETHALIPFSSVPEKPL